MAKTLETEVARPVVNWLQERGYEVYQEVEYNSWVADIVAVKYNRIWIIECKNTLTLKVIQQAHRWFPFSHWRSFAIPWSASLHPESALIHNICAWVGMCWIDVGPIEVREIARPQLNRKASCEILEVLEEEHKTYAEAGSRASKRWTPWKSTLKKVQNYVKKKPGCRLKSLLDDGM
jgi:hypothetical protein